MSVVHYRLGMSHAIKGRRHVHHDDAHGLPLLLGFLPSADCKHQGVLSRVVVAICKLRTLGTGCVCSAGWYTAPVRLSQENERRLAIETHASSWLPGKQLPDLYRGATFDFLKAAGTHPVERDTLKISSKDGARTWAASRRTSPGTLSLPVAFLGSTWRRSFWTSWRVTASNAPKSIAFIGPKGTGNVSFHRASLMTCPNVVLRAPMGASDSRLGFPFPVTMFHTGHSLCGLDVEQCVFFDC